VRHAQTRHDPGCEICVARMVEHKCNISCPNCGYTRDCSEP